MIKRLFVLVALLQQCSISVTMKVKSVTAYYKPLCTVTAFDKPFKQIHLLLRLDFLDQITLSQ